MPPSKPPGRLGGEQTRLQHPVPPHHGLASIDLQNQNEHAIAQEPNSDVQDLCVRRVARAWGEGSGAEAGEPGCVAHGEAYVGQVDWVDGEEELDFLADPS